MALKAILDGVDFIDIVTVLFGLILLGAVITAYFMGMDADPDLKAWFFAVLTFLIGKKMPISSGR